MCLLKTCEKIGATTGRFTVIVDNSVTKETRDANKFETERKTHQDRVKIE